MREMTFSEIEGVFGAGQSGVFYGTIGAILGAAACVKAGPLAAGCAFLGSKAGEAFGNWLDEQPEPEEGVAFEQIAPPCRSCK